MKTPVEKWIAALESGKYKQTTERLNVGNKHCCLGVACELYAKEHPDWPVNRSGMHTVFGKGSTAILPDEVREWLGLTGSSGSFHTDLEADSLTMKNDRGATFKEIAEIIKSRPTGLFV